MWLEFIEKAHWMWFEYKIVGMFVDLGTRNLDSTALVVRGEKFNLKYVFFSFI